MHEASIFKPVAGLVFGLLLKCIVFILSTSFYIMSDLFLNKTKPKSEMSENDLAEIVVEVGFQIHRKWGPGLLESVYEALLVYHLIGRAHV